jgi:hypothetical protein
MAAGTFTGDGCRRDVVYNLYILYMAVGTFSGDVTVGTKAPVVGTCK